MVEQAIGAVELAWNRDGLFLSVRQNDSVLLIGDFSSHPGAPFLCKRAEDGQFFLYFALPDYDSPGSDSFNYWLYFANFLLL